METTFGRGTTPVRGQQRSPCWLTTYPSPGMILHSLNGYYPLKICRDPNGKDRLNRPSSGGWSNHLGWSNQVPCHGISSIHPSRWILNFGKPTQPTLNQIGTSESWDDPSKSLTFLFWGAGHDEQPMIGFLILGCLNHLNEIISPGSSPKIVEPHTHICACR